MPFDPTKLKPIRRASELMFEDGKAVPAPRVRRLIQERQEAMAEALRLDVEANMVEAIFGFRPDWAPPKK